jgi:cytochrome c556
VAYSLRIACTVAAASLASLGAVALAPTNNLAAPADKKLAKDADTWTEMMSEKEFQGVVKLYVEEMKTKVMKSKGLFSSGYKKALQAGHVFAILGNAGTVAMKGDEAKTAAALRDAGMELAKAAKAKKYDDAKAAFEKVAGYPGKIEPAASADTAKWDVCTNIEMVMENVSRIDSDNTKAIKSSAEFGKGGKELAMRMKLMAALAVVARETKNEEAWQGFCDDMRAASIDLAKQYGAKNLAGAKSANDALQKSCKNCHDKYNVQE